MKKIVAKAKVLLRRFRKKIEILLAYFLPTPLLVNLYEAKSKVKYATIYKVKYAAKYFKKYHKIPLFSYRLLPRYYDKNSGELLFPLLHRIPIKIGTFQIYKGGEIFISYSRGVSIFAFNQLFLFADIRIGQYSFIREMLFS